MASCLVCKAPSDSTGSLCAKCQVRMKERGRTFRPQSPEPVREEHTGLSQLDKVMEEDRQKSEAQSRKRGAKK